MSEERWKQLAYKKVTVDAANREDLQLGKLLGVGGAGAVYELCEWNGHKWVIKVLDPDSPVAVKELKSLNRYRGNIRYAPDLMKFHSWTGKLEYNGEKYLCYMMRKGRTLADAIKNQELWVSETQEVMRITAQIVNGICSLKNAGLSHGDIKADNILLYEYENTFYAMLSDYGTVSGKRHEVLTIAYHCKESEYDSSLEECIAYDLHCLYLVLCKIYKVEDDTLPLCLDQKIFKLLRIMRNANKKAFERLREIMEFLKENYIDTPVSFYLDAIPRYELTEKFPFDKIMQREEYIVLRDKNAVAGEAFDPLLLMKIPTGRYDIVYKILVKHNKLNDFVMPIARYFDKCGNEYVLIHAPDDRNKCLTKFKHDIKNKRIQDNTGIPYTLATENDVTQEHVVQKFSDKLTHLRVNIEIAAGDIWQLDGIWKLNLFSAKSIELDVDKSIFMC